MERFHSRGQHTCKFTETKGSVYIRKEFNSQRIGLVHQHGRRFIVLEHQYGGRDVIWKHSIVGDAITFFVCFINGLEEKNSKSEVIFAVCRLECR